jgi:hypothetical protein
MSLIRIALDRQCQTKDDHSQQFSPVSPLVVGVVAAHFEVIDRGKLNSQSAMSKTIEDANEKLPEQTRIQTTRKPVSWWRRYLDPLEFDLLYLSTIFKLALFPA